MKTMAALSYVVGRGKTSSSINRTHLRPMCWLGVWVSISAAARCCTPFHWEKDHSSVDVIYTNTILVKQAKSYIVCADLCSDLKCASYSYTTDSQDCRGYRDTLTGPESRRNTSHWKRVCKRTRYIYDPILEACVKLFTIEKTWEEAKEFCHNSGTHLLIIDTPAKLQATKYGLHGTIFQTKNHWWLGAYDYDEGPGNNFKWINGEPLRDDLWNPSEPNIPDERCVNLYSWHTSLNDYMCSRKEFFVCQEY